MRHRLLIALLFAGCSEAATLPGEVPLDCTPTSTTYRIDQVTAPLDSAAANDAGTDLDDDGTIDNQAGAIVSAVSQVYQDLQTDLQPRWDARFTTDAVWLVTIERCDGAARVTISDDATEGLVPAAGEDLGGEIRARDGVGAAPLGVFADLAGGGAIEWQPIYPAAIDVQISGDELTGTIAGAFGGDYQTLVAQAFLPYLQNRLDNGDTAWGASVDTDHDGILTIGELLANDTFRVLVSADLDAGDGTLAPPEKPVPDGRNESLSFGFAIHAVRVP